MEVLEHYEFKKHLILRKLESTIDFTFLSTWNNREPSIWTKDVTLLKANYCQSGPEIPVRRPSIACARIKRNSKVRQFYKASALVQDRYFAQTLGSF